MREAQLAISALTVGSFVGAIFFGGLWWTVRNALTANNAALWFLLSLVLRMGVALAGFFGVSSGGWQSVLLCLCGFLMARAAVTHMTQPATERRHAP